MNFFVPQTIILGLLLLVLPNSLSAQPNSEPNLFEQFTNPNFLESDDSQILFLCRSGQRLSLKGDTRQFLSETWQEGLVLDHSEHFFKIEVKYRLYDGEMLIKRGDDLCVVQQPTVKAISFDEKIFISIPFENDRSEEELGYFELLAEGEIRLLRKYKLKGNRVKHCLYLQVDGAMAKPFKGNKKDLLKYMGDHQQSMESYLTNHKTNWKNAEDLQAIIDYYHRLGAEG